jgi:RimJ/RimL family protein N-acetyltransferase/GNAT superfamily N-acetyltransferase
MFPELRTPRLLIRPVRADDVDPLLERRNDPQVAELQAWVTPYPRERAESIVSEVLAMDGPVDGQWFMATIVELASDEVIGELVLHPTNELRTAEVGYSLSTRHWGKGYAAEALGAFVAWIVEALPVTRLAGMLHPDNRASAMVLERTGFVFEGHTRLSFWLGDDNSDDWIYGMTRADWEAWQRRPRTTPADVRLAPVTQENRAAVLALRTHHSQRAFVAPVLDSFADALLPEVVDGVALVPWLRAIEADGGIVGFAMLALSTPHHPEPYLWRLLIDRMHQRRGIGSRALGLIAGECRTSGDSTLLVSWVEGKGTPRGFYLAHGFVPTGRIVDGETEARLSLT